MYGFCRRDNLPSVGAKTGWVVLIALTVLPVEPCAANTRVRYSAVTSYPWGFFHGDAGSAV